MVSDHDEMPRIPLPGEDNDYVTGGFALRIEDSLMLETMAAGIEFMNEGAKAYGQGLLPGHIVCSIYYLSLFIRYPEFMRELATTLGLGDGRNDEMMEIIHGQLSHAFTDHYLPMKQENETRRRAKEEDQH